MLGAGGHAKQIVDVFKMNDANIYIEVYDDNMQGSFRGYRIQGNTEDFINRIVTMYHSSDLIHKGLFIAIGNNKVRKRILNQINWKISLTSEDSINEETYNKDYIRKYVVNCISPYAHIAPSVNIGYGNYIGSHTCILQDSNIGDGNIVNDNSTVMHDCKVGDYNLIAPGATLCGGVVIGDYNLIGANASMIPKMKLGDENVVGAGAAVVKSYESGNTLLGVPARPRI